MNLAQSTKMVLEELNLVSADGTPKQRALPWRQSLGLNRREEDVRPIFWKNRNKSYVARTQDWDEFPNGRWGDARSPAFGHLDTYGIGLKGTNEQNIKLWGSPTTVREVASIFLAFLNKKVSSLPWSETGLTAEAEEIKSDLLELNGRGFLTINSQPAVTGIRSSDPIHGWGPHGGYCYQKAYLELLVPPSLIEGLLERISEDETMTFYAVNKAGDLHTNAPTDGPNAVTWGVFPGKEIVQPTIVETISFLAWKDEAFKLGSDWARCYPITTPSRHLINSIMENWYLVNIGERFKCSLVDRKRADRKLVDNDFHRSHEIFKLFKDLEVPDMDNPMEVPNVTANGESHATHNGDSKLTNGDSKPSQRLSN